MASVLKTLFFLLILIPFAEAKDECTYKYTDKPSEAPNNPPRSSNLINVSNSANLNVICFKKAPRLPGQACLIEASTASDEICSRRFPGSGLDGAKDALAKLESVKLPPDLRDDFNAEWLVKLLYRESCKSPESSDCKIWKKYYAPDESTSSAPRTYDI